LQLVKFEKGDVIFESGKSISHHYFPVDCVLVLSIRLADGQVGDTVAVDKTSIYPLHLVGGGGSHNSAIIRAPGWCYRLPAHVLHSELQTGTLLLWILLAEAVKLFEQATLESVCLRHHSLAQITAKLILISMDKTQSDNLPFTHAEMANSIGVRREGVTLTLNEFNRKKLIESRRGHIVVLDRTGIEKISCNCYWSLQTLARAHPP
jgi:hypothetical protein